jgi:hypothetical protein
MQINFSAEPVESNTGDSWYPRLTVKTTKKIVQPEIEIWRGDKAYWIKSEAEQAGLDQLATRLRRVI